jgi:hypothetical protein
VDEEDSLKRDRLDDAVLFTQAIDATSHERQRDRSREQLTLAQIDRHADSIDELDVQGILPFDVNSKNFRRSLLLCAIGVAPSCTAPRRYRTKEPFGSYAITAARRRRLNQRPGSHAGDHEHLRDSLASSVPAPRRRL